MKAKRGVEVGNIFKLGVDFSAPMGCTYTAADGTERPVVMGSYGIGSGRLLACIAEEHHDDYGLVWPVSVAPYQVHLVGLVGKEAGSPTLELAESLYSALQNAGLEVLYDDRLESPGVKFNDADLIGLPLRLTVSERAIKQGGVELKRRDLADKEILTVDLDQSEIDFAPIIHRLHTELANLQAEIQHLVTQVPYS